DQRKYGGKTHDPGAAADDGGDRRCRCAGTRAIPWRRCPRRGGRPGGRRPWRGLSAPASKPSSRPRRCPRTAAVWRRPRAGRGTASGVAAPVRRRRGLRRWLPAPAAVLLAGVAALLWSAWSPGTVHQTARGQILRVALEDGSTVTLDAETRLRVRYTAHGR